MRIAYLGIKGIPSRWGADRVVEAIVRGLAERHDITVYCSSRQTPSEAHYRGVCLVRLPSLSGKFSHMVSLNVLAAWNAVLLGDFDLIHLHNIEASFVLPILRLRYRVITTAHGRITAGNKWGGISVAAMRLMEMPFVWFSNSATSVSLPDAVELRAKYGRAIEYIPNGIEALPEVDEGAARAILKRYGAAPQQYLLFVAGRIVPLKGPHLMLEALRRIDGECRLLLVGDLSQSAEYSRRLKALADDRVLFIPFLSARPVLLGLMRLSSVVVFPSTIEGMSMTLLEAAGVGAPILCSDIAANTAVVPEQALYFTSGDVDDLASKLRWALDHPREMKRLGEQARARVQEKYSWDSVIRQYEHLYQLVVSRV